MGVGYEPSMGSINSSAGKLAVGLRGWARATTDFHAAIVDLGPDAASRATALVAMGFTQADATNMVRLADVINTMAALYYGNAAQPTPYNFDNDLSALWGMQLNPWA